MLDKFLKKTSGPKPINKRGGNVFEQHAEKIVLGVSGLLCLWLLVAFVLMSPNAERVGGRKLRPGKIDAYVKAQADQLAAAVNENASPGNYTAGAAVAKVTSKLNNSIDNIADFRIAAPKPSELLIAEDRQYPMPVVGGIDKVAVSAIRGAAHVPVEEVGMDKPYDTAMTKLGDIDLVTVQGSFDLPSLYRSFKQSFSLGRGLKSEWRDDELATPVFAAAQVQRRQLLDDGRWGDWVVVDRPRIDKYRSKLNVSEDVSQLRYDISMLKDQFKSFECQLDILQPEPYDFASANSMWLVPSYLKEYVSVQEQQKMEKLKQDREKQRNERLGRTGYTSRSTRGEDEAYGAYDSPAAGGPRTGRMTAAEMRAMRTAPGGGRPGVNPPGVPGRMTDGRDYNDEYGYGGGFMSTDPLERRLKEIITENIKILINERTPLDQMRDVLTFWAHDDTAAPGNTYQYRIRLGVFNPVAGKGWVAAKDEAYDKQVILWSDFSNVTEPVEIPPMVHFFPTEIVRTGENGVRVQVSKYYLGNWRSENFDVYPGELIGKEIEAPAKIGTPAMGRGYDEYADSINFGAPASTPEKIDFNTGARLVDLVTTDRWTGLSTLVRSQIVDMLYTVDGSMVVHLPVKRNNWTDEMRAQFAVIEEAASQQVTLSQSRGQSILKRGQTGGYGVYGSGPYDRGDGRESFGRPYVD